MPERGLTVEAGAEHLRVLDMSQTTPYRLLHCLLALVEVGRQTATT
jgi:hypothetical protein